MVTADERLEEKPPYGAVDTEKNAAVTTNDGPVTIWTRIRDLAHRAIVAGRVELRGVAPIPVKERTVDRTINIFTLWWSMNANILPIAFGMIGPASGLSLRDSALVILFFVLLTTLLPAYLSTLGPKIGMRQMIQARYSYGRYLVSIPVFLNLATMTGFCIIIAVIGGQCLSAVADGNLSVTVGIVIISLVTLVISFCGYKWLHIYERYAWIPAFIAIIVAAGCGGKDLANQVPTEPAKASAVLSYGMIMASYMVPWACLASDFTTYLKPETSSVKIFCYSYFGLATPTILLMTLGAAVGGAIPNNPHWQAKYDESLVGGILDAMLAPAGGFGKFLVVVLAFTLLGNLAATSYSITLNFQMLVPVLFKYRRGGQFFLNMENFLALIGYWSSAFLGVVLVEHFVYRKGDCSRYDPEAWNDARLLPWGVAALASSALCFAVVVPSMAQVWWTGPIARTTGDIGFELAFVVSALLYVPLRWVERRYLGR
ncbi:permease for cytosine/purines, uracil, thiamine, allantoin-domain-containing protein [Apiosordaria backusii]|uniref:Permease for cytosine/purines, uracil, thiamine, allantoin-domain-containing protein n=1 Tax=Apiosordaria backusii TaxID=314023 RepID=A0AA40BSG3_9PEZI|nr:permease for cytosine/purines, uracil, thiamine, allantoin-domain-containing protein [Apiosordaria backusii]